MARAACDVFIAKGYRGTRLTDVAERLELSHALLYRYVESKEALLELAVRYAMDQEADLEAAVPLATPAEGRIAELVGAWLTTRATFTRLRGSLEQQPGDDARAVLAGVIDELYDFIESNRLVLLLIESLADDFPEISGEAVNDRKHSLNGRLAAFLAGRAATGEMRPIADPEVAAHFVAETIAWFAQHRKRDPNAAAIDDRQARATVRELLLAAFIPDTPTTGMKGTQR